MTAAAVPIEKALSDPQLLGARFGEDASSWRTWFAVIKAAYGRPLTKAERVVFDLAAGGRKPPRHKVRELICVVSRRGGKGSVAGALCTYEAALVKHDLAPGERGAIACVSPTRAQATIVRDYCEGFFSASPILQREIVDTTADELRLRSGVVVSTLAADYRSLRGRTLLLAVLDEGAFLADDLECVRALQPGLATTGGTLIVLSSPYRRSGFLYERHRDFFGRDDDDVLVVSGPSELFNSTLDKKMLAKARAADPEGASAEWGGEFRSDAGSLFDDDTIERAIDRARPPELPPRPGVHYSAFCDPAGGGRGDSYAIAVAHKEGDGSLVVDAIRGAVGKFDPAKVTANFAGMLREYEISSVTGDAFAAGWVSGAWFENGISYRQSELKRSDIYLGIVPTFSRGLVRLPDHPRLLRELRLLERRTGRNGRESVDHPRGATDDHANVACGALHGANVAAPSLWQRELLAGNGFTMPKSADCLFATVMADEYGIGAIFFLYRRWNEPQLILLDYDQMKFAPQSFHAVIDRLRRLAQSTPANATFVFTQSELAEEFARLGYFKGVATIDAIAGDQMLALSAATHISAGRVKLATDARTRTEKTPLGLLDGTMSDDADPVRLAALVGIAVALDAHRQLGRQAA